MKKFSITEIFYSLQGEGFWTGTPAVFVRFAGCNLNCHFCDTNYNPNHFLTQDEIVNQIQTYPSNRVILTGGEPTLQLTQSLIDALHEAGKMLHLETNGVNLLEVQGIDWLTVSPKLPGLGWRIRDGHELKVVYEGQTLSEYAESRFDHYFLQPCSMKNIHETIVQVKQCPQWRLSFQTHKALNIP